MMPSQGPRRRQDLAGLPEREGSLLASFATDAGRDPRRVLSPVAIVWPCPLTVDAYVAAGREVEFPRLDCPSCARRMGLWSGYWRYIRAAGRCRKMFVPRERCGCCRVSHALLPAFVLAWRLDTAETVGAVFAALAVELGGEAIRPAADPGRFALAAVGAAFGAAAGLPGWAGLGAWRFASSVSGGRLLAANTTSPWLIVGRRRFMPPVPP